MPGLRDGFRDLGMDAGISGWMPGSRDGCRDLEMDAGLSGWMHESRDVCRDLSSRVNPRIGEVNPRIFGIGNYMKNYVLPPSTP